MHVLLVTLQIVVISMFVVGLNTSIQSVKQRLSSVGLSRLLKHCRPGRSLSIFSRKKRENNSHPWAPDWNSDYCCTRHLGSQTIVFIFAFSMAVTYNCRCFSRFVLLDSFSCFRFYS